MPPVLSKAYIDKLPNELLAWIVEISNSDDTQHNGATSCQKFVLAGVCTKWRGVAQGTARLWADLPVTLNTVPAYVEFIFGLTREAPLALTIDLAHQLPHPPGTSGVLETATVEEFLESVAPILATKTVHIRCLHILAYLEKDLRQLLLALGHLSGTGMKDLHLEVICPRPLDDTLPQTPEPLPLFQSTSCLQTLGLINVPLLLAEVMFASVKNLTLDRTPGLTWSELSHNLRAMISLESLTLWGPVCADYDTQTVVSLPCLTTLALRISGPSDIPLALAMLRMPALIWLRIGRTNGAIEPVLSALGDALADITRLELYSRPTVGNNKHEDEISAVWECTPKLSFVDFNKTAYADMKKFVSVLKENTGRFPLLNSIHTDYGFPEGTIEELLRVTSATLVTPSTDSTFTEVRWSWQDGGARRSKFIVWAV
ncbi:hypothetical protein B0H16DRAFT_1728698 [Mycena metata]|uniref:F-box domain-containing protein n=1 Tax=Mycena metata TaxID=1033252 RepID=A0AAD7IG64_9AGAR|nr:hypothetical protein B0H16DRAFT_1728698 [Mycena metata]